MVYRKLIALLVAICTQIASCSKDTQENSLIAEINRIYSRDSIVKVDKIDGYSGSPEEYIESLGDKYGKYISPENAEIFKQDINGYYYGLGINCKIHKDKQSNRVEIVGVVPSSPADTLGIVTGSTLLKINGQTVDNIETNDELKDLLKGNLGDTIEIQIEQNEEIKTFNVIVSKIKSKNVDYKIIDENIGYISISGFKPGVKEDFNKAIYEMLTNNIYNFILDVRNNGGGYITEVIPVIDRVVPAGLIATLKEANNKTTNITSDKECLNGNIVILVNENTASAAELFALSIKEHNKATLIGKRTHGKATELGAKQLSNGGLLVLSTGTYETEFTPSIEGTGIQPDIEVDNVDNTDSQLDEAIRILSRSKK